LEADDPTDVLVAKKPAQNFASFARIAQVPGLLVNSEQGMAKKTSAHPLSATEGHAGSYAIVRAMTVRGAWTP
jgi:hypothetical protein